MAIVIYKIMILIVSMIYEFLLTEEPGILPGKSPEIGTRRKQRLPTPASSFDQPDQPRPVARILPMSRDESEWEMVIPPPLEKGDTLFIIIEKLMTYYILRYEPKSNVNLTSTISIC